MTGLGLDFDTEFGRNFHDVSFDDDMEEYNDESLFEPLPWENPIEIDSPLLMNLLTFDVIKHEIDHERYSESHVIHDRSNAYFPCSNIGQHVQNRIITNSSGNNHFHPYVSSSYNSSISSEFRYPTTGSSRSYPDIIEKDFTANDMCVQMSPWYPSTKDPESNKKRKLHQYANSFIDNPSDHHGIHTILPTSSTTKSKKKSKRQPRPKLFVTPRSGGPIYQLNPHDVLSGRGGRVNSQSGNIQFRDIVAQYKAKYVDPNTRKLQKAHIAADIVHLVRSKGGRFLIEDDYCPGLWYEIGDAKAIRKAGQALREEPNQTTILGGIISSDDSDSCCSSDYAEDILRNTRGHKTTAF